jgi:hypothetical protein
LKTETITYRNDFASFLDRLASGDSPPADWQQFVVAHYPDEFLEEIRRNVVRLYQDRLPIESKADAAIQLLNSWSLTIRSSIETSVADNDEIGIPICLTPSEFVVLDGFLRRYSESDNLNCEHPSEKQVLWNLQCILERIDRHPNLPSRDVARDALAPPRE